MVFKRRDRRPWHRVLAEALWPRGGYVRAFEYVKHRLRRLPDTPEKISRGIWAGVFASWTPFFGVHFIVAIVLARAMRGNIVASLIGTFFGNPLTYLPIAIISLRTGHFVLGSRLHGDAAAGMGRRFADAGQTLWDNFLALFTAAPTNWERLEPFWRELFIPYLVGGVIPGILSATAVYLLVLPVIRAYQNRRKKALRARLAQLGKAPGSGE